MPAPLDRRQFLHSSAAGVTAAALAAQSLAQENEAPVTKSANEKIVVAVMGVNGRGSALAQAFLAQPNVEVGYLCDVDERAIAKVAGPVADRQGRQAKGIKDFREALDDKSLDVLVCAAPNHWHAPATILGCSAGKHVYVEKPCSHNPREGELAVAAARKNNCVVQMGSQRRSRPGIIEGIAKLHKGDLGRVLYARTWYNNRRPSIGHGKEASVPAWLDWSLWQGPAPERPFLDNIVHYNWHWRWHWGNGELGNNGVHALDVARWGLGVDYPTTVVSAGAKARHDDDQETPDTHAATYTFAGKSAADPTRTITWEGLSWSPYGPGGSGFGVTFHCDNGTLSIGEDGFTVYDDRNKLVEEVKGKGGDGHHFANFLDCIRSGQRPNADIEEAHKSTLLCHLGNIAYKLSQRGEAVVIDPQAKAKDDPHRISPIYPKAEPMWGREYRQGWEPVV